jgi:hypothetical protein
MAMSPPSRHAPQFVPTFMMILLQHAAHRDGKHGDPGYPNLTDWPTRDFALSQIPDL